LPVTAIDSLKLRTIRNTLTSFDKPLADHAKLYKQMHTNVVLPTRLRSDGNVTFVFGAFQTAGVKELFDGGLLARDENGKLVSGVWETFENGAGGREYMETLGITNYLPPADFTYAHGKDTSKEHKGYVILSKAEQKAYETKRVALAKVAFQGFCGISDFIYTISDSVSVMLKNLVGTAYTSKKISPQPIHTGSLNQNRSKLPVYWTFRLAFRILFGHDNDYFCVLGISQETRAKEKLVRSLKAMRAGHARWVEEGAPQPAVGERLNTPVLTVDGVVREFRKESAKVGETLDLRTILGLRKQGENREVREPTAAVGATLKPGTVRILRGQGEHREVREPTAAVGATLKPSTVRILRGQGDDREVREPTAAVGATLKPGTVRRNLGQGDDRKVREPTAAVGATLKPRTVKTLRGQGEHREVRASQNKRKQNNYSLFEENDAKNFLHRIERNPVKDEVPRSAEELAAVKKNNQEELETILFDFPDVTHVWRCDCCLYVTQGCKRPKEVPVPFIAFRGSEKNTRAGDIWWSLSPQKPHRKIRRL
jgi:rubrerythrin